MKTAKAPVALLLVLCATTLIFAQATKPSWLHPTDAEYRAAILAGFTASKAARKYAEPAFGGGGWNNPAINGNMISPLDCAVKLGTVARHALKNAPTVLDAKNTCDGLLTLRIYRSASQSEFFNSFPKIHAALELSGKRLAPAATKQGNASTPEWNSLFNAWEAHESDYFIFRPTAPLTGNVTLIYTVDGDEGVYKSKMNVSKLVKDEAQHRAEAVKATP